MEPRENEIARGLLGQSPEISSIRRLIEKASRNRLPVLILGESGTGKEVVARAIHAAKPRGQFVPIDCGSLVDTLMESELFGHTKGSFSGAAESKKGLVEIADGGTAFFDEIGDLPLAMQVKLLRLTQEREFRAVGALAWRSVDLRVIAATHRNLRAEVAAGRFRQDLYYRLNVFTIRLPPLRERKQDIPLLIDHFIHLGTAAGLPEFRPGPELIDVLTGYDWPGNVRELKHCIDRLSAMQSEGMWNAAYLPSPLQDGQQTSGLNCLSEVLNSDRGRQSPETSLARISPITSILESERHSIENALAATGGERARAAQLLGIGRTTLYRKMKQYGLG